MVVSSGEHVTTAGGVKVKVLPLDDGLYPVEGWGVVPSAATNISGTLATICNLPDINGIRFPAGTFNVDNNLWKRESLSTPFEIAGAGSGLDDAATVINIKAGVQMSSPPVTSITLAADVARGTTRRHSLT